MGEDGFAQTSLKEKEGKLVNKPTITQQEPRCVLENLARV